MAENRIAEDAADVAADLAALKSDIARLTATVAALVEQETTAAADHVRSRVRSATEAAEAKAEQLKESGKAALGEAQARAAGAVGDVSTAIERNPIAAVAIAAGLGLLVGLFTRRD